MASPEALLIEMAGGHPDFTALVHATGPLMVAFDTLTDIDGWMIDPTSPNSRASFDLPELSGEQRIVGALLVATDYAIRRGATDRASAEFIIRRESPVGFIDYQDGETGAIEIARSLDLVTPRPRSFDRRALGHELSGDILSDPSLSFIQRSYDVMIGDNALSSFIVHAEGEVNELSVTGAIGPRWGVEVGLDSSITVDQLPELEAQIATIPSFMRGVSSRLDDDGLVVCWPNSVDVNPHQIGRVIQAWTRALFDVALVDVRIVFAPPKGRSAVLTEMRARAKAYRLYRDAVLAGHPDPEQVVAEYQQSHREDE